MFVSDESNEVAMPEELACARADVMRASASQDTWNVITDTWHEDVAAAVGQANFEFGLLHFEQA